MIELYDIDNQKGKYELLFMFNKNNKNFIVYEDKDNEILASYYEKDGDKLIITPILDDNDYDIVDKELKKWWNNNEI